MGRYRKLTSKRFSEGTEAYFDSISRYAPAIELYDTGETNKKGLPIMGRRPIMDDDGNPHLVLEWLRPPSISSLCLYLGISRDTFAEYAHMEGYSDTASYARARVEAYLEEQLVSSGKSPQGIIFALENNFGWRKKHEVGYDEATRRTLEAKELSMSEREALLKDVAATFLKNDQELEDQ